MISKTALLIFSLTLLFAISKPYNVEAQGAGDGYKASWKTTDFLTATYNVSWDRKILALGPASWLVEFYEKKANEPYVNTVSEIWSTSSINDCYGHPLDCTPNGTNDDGKTGWLWGTGGSVPYNTLQTTFTKTAIGEPSLYFNNHTNNTYDRGDGPALIWEPGDSSSLAIWAQGAYGWAYGSVSGNYARASIVNVGIMMPLKWQVEGRMVNE